MYFLLPREYPKDFSAEKLFGITSVLEQNDVL